MNDQLKLLDFSDEDFDMLVDGLNALPEKGMTVALMGDMMGAMFAKDPEDLQKITQAREKKNAEHKRNLENKREDIMILQGKLLMLKRYLKQEGALKTAQDILNKDL